MTYNGIIKVLKDEIKRADYVESYYIDCVDIGVFQKALDFIKRQKEVINRLNIELQSMRSAANSYKMELERLKSEIEKANEVDRKAEIQALKESKENAKLFCEAINNAKSEVVKEFTKKVDKLLERYSQ